MANAEPGASGGEEREEGDEAACIGAGCFR